MQGTTSANSVSTPRSCEMVKEAASNWEMAKSMGVNISKEEGTIISKLVNLERHKGLIQRKGSSVGV